MDGVSKDDKRPHSIGTHLSPVMSPGMSPATATALPITVRKLDALRAAARLNVKTKELHSAMLQCIVPEGPLEDTEHPTVFVTRANGNASPCSRHYDLRSAVQSTLSPVFLPGDAQSGASSMSPLQMQSARNFQSICDVCLVPVSAISLQLGGWCRGVRWWFVSACSLCVWCGVVWCGVVWCGVVWCGVVWCGVVWCGVVCRRRCYQRAKAGMSTHG